MAAETKPEFRAIFEELKGILKAYEEKLELQHDTESNYYLNTGVIQKKQPVFFGAARIGKGYVSYYLMPVYMFPEMLEGIPEELKSRMQGKSCFNFKKVDPPLIEELRKLTKEGYERYREAGLTTGS